MSAFSPSLPYASQRQPLYADNVVATSQPLAAQAGLAMLARGGNAIDAAVATAIALTVVEPTTNGIGGDLFAIVWDGQALARAQRVGTRAGRVDPAALRVARPHADLRLGRGHHPRPGRGLARAVRALRRPALRRPVRARDPLRARRLPRRAHHRGAVAARGAGDPAGPRLRHALPAPRPRAARRRAIRQRVDGRDAGGDRAERRRGLLSRASRGSHGRARRGERRRRTRSRTSRPPRRTGCRRSRCATATSRCTRSRPTARASPR